MAGSRRGFDRSFIDSAVTRKARTRWRAFMAGHRFRGESSINEWGGVGPSSQQPVYLPQFGGDVDLLYAGREAVAASDAGRAVLRRGGVIPPRPVKVVIIPGVP